MTLIQPPHRGRPRPTVRLNDQPLDDRERSHYSSRAADAMLLGLVVAVLLANGLILWNQLGSGQEHVRRALFFGLVLLCLLWAAVVYTFKLSVSVRVGSQGLAIVRGPWRTELPWREVARLVERTQLYKGQRYRWVVALARDGRQLQVREDMVGNYLRFRYEVNERYRLWQEHGGTWGTTGGGPFKAREVVANKITWWSVLGGLLLLPGLYFAIFLPETGVLGPALLVLAGICAAMALRVLLRRQTYMVDMKSLTARRFLGSMRLTWREVARIERTRHAFSALLAAGIAVGRFVVQVAARTDPRIQSFAWYPRVPEYLILRGAGRHIRIALHRVARPDELLAWVEFYERLGRRTASTTTSGQLRRPPDITDRLLQELAPADLSEAGGPPDPWAVGPEQSSFSTSAPTESREPDAARRVTPGIDTAGASREGFASQAETEASAPDWMPGAGTRQEAAKAGDARGDSEREQTSTMGDLLGAFAPWRTDPSWSPPPLPRFGPPTSSGSGETEPTGDEAEFKDDEFLR